MDSQAFQQGGGFGAPGTQWGQGPSSEAFGAAMGGASSYDSSQTWGSGLGSMGQMSSGNQSAQGSMDDGWTGHDDDEDSTPLLQELEIYPDHIREKTLEVLNPARPIKDEYLQDADLAGPLVFCLVLGVCLLFAGKVHFGYIYSFGLMGCGALWTVLNLMSSKGHDASHEPIDFSRVLSVFGYCLLPIILIAVLTVFVTMTGIVGSLFALTAVAWCTYSAVRFFEAITHMKSHRWLLAYPTFLLYACFALITVF